MLTAAGMIIGTPAYMAPEQFNAAQPDARTDVFSLGVIAYEMLSGELPFGRGTLADVVLAQARGVPPLPANLVPPAAERAIRSALEPDPDRRPASPQAFATSAERGVWTPSTDDLQRGETLVDLGDRRLDLLLAHRVRGRIRLAC